MPVLNVKLHLADAVDIQSRSAGYGIALLVGVVLVYLDFPTWALCGDLPPGAPPRADFAQHVIGQSYFLSQSWSINPRMLLFDRTISPPYGTNIAFTDSMPLLTILSKLVRPLAPPFHQTITLYQAAAWLLQPLSAVFALRSAGERRWPSALAVSIMASSMPTFLFRLWHAALSGHFWLMIMLGLSIRMQSGAKKPLLVACVLQVMLLLIHPYLMAMATALLVAAALSLWFRGREEWQAAALLIVLSCSSTFVLGQLLGYWEGGSDGGYGYYSMNLVAPFWPTFSHLLGHAPITSADATGGQAEGYQYLGLGYILLLAASAFARPQWSLLLRRNTGLLIVCGALSALCVTNWVFFLHMRLAHVPLPSRWFAQVRGSGRLFWPVSYSMMIASFLVVLRYFQRAGLLIVSVASVLQLLDAQDLRRVDRTTLSGYAPFPFNQIAFEKVIREKRRITILPTFPCNGGGLSMAMDVLWLAGKYRLSMNSMYVARDVRSQDCLPPEVMRTPVASDEIRVVLPGFAQDVIDMAHPEQCRLLQSYLLCAQHEDALSNLPTYMPPIVPTSEDIMIARGSLGEKVLLAGWAPIGPTVGTWSTEQTAYIGARLPPTSGAHVHVRLRAAGMPARASSWREWLGVRSRKRIVTVWAGSRQIDAWSVGEPAATYDVSVPASSLQSGGALVLQLRTSALVSSLDRGRTTDPRRFGIWLKSVSFTPVP